MLQFLDVIQKLYNKNNVQIGNCLFNLHHVNSFLLCLFFLSSMLRELSGGSGIMCDDFNNIASSSEAVNQYCLHLGLHIVIPLPEYTRRSPTEKEKAYFTKFNHNGKIGPGLQNPYTKNTYVKNITYYRWIPFAFLFLAFLSYLPFKIWHDVEGGEIHSLCSGLKLFHKKDARRKNVDKLKDAFVERKKRGNFYGSFYLSLQTFNILLILFQSWFWCQLFGERFRSYGIAYLFPSLTDKNIESYMFFPIRAKCQYNLGGPGGNIVVSRFIRNCDSCNRIILEYRLCLYAAWKLDVRKNLPLHILL